MAQRVQIVMSLMRQNLHRELPLSQYARAVYISYWHLSHLFKATPRTTPGQYLKHLRMQHAKELLEQTLLQIKEIRIRVGIADESHFFRDFKKAFSCSPTQYRLMACKNFSTDQAALIAQHKRPVISIIHASIADSLVTQDHLFTLMVALGPNIRSLMAIVAPCNR